MPRQSLPLARTLLVPFVLGLAAACTTTVVAPIPEPYPETLAWALDAPQGHGAFLGLEVRENDSGSLDELFFEPGARVVAVNEGSPALAVGLRAGDVVLAFDGATVNDPEALDALLRQREPGAATLEVRRGDTVFEVVVELRAHGGAAELPAPRELYRVDPARSRAGWIAGQGGVVLAATDADGPFAKAGLEVGCVVRAVGREDVHSARDLIRRLAAREPGDTVRVDYVDTAGEEQRARVTLQAEPRRATEGLIPILFNYTGDVDGTQCEWALVDLYFISLFRYRRDGSEREYRFLRWFRYSSGVGELEE
jgi:S1-C subfamily serine protease